MATVLWEGKRLPKAVVTALWEGKRLPKAVATVLWEGKEATQSCGHGIVGR